VPLIIISGQTSARDGKLCFQNPEDLQKRKSLG